MPARRLTALVDCSAFYCSCERAFRPDLRKTPIAVLSNNDGCVIARDPLAKALGVPMGAPYFKVRRQLARDGVEVFSSNYALYADLSRRVMSTLERFTPDVERASIDEAFLTFRAEAGPDGLPAEAERARLEALAADVRAAVLGATGIPVRVSIAETKTLAKAASEYARGTGGAVCFWGHPDRDAFLESLPVEDVWGIGPRWARRLRDEGVTTAARFAALDDTRLRRFYTVCALRTAFELRGTPCIVDAAGTRKTMVRSRSFGTKTSDLGPALEAVANHAARAARKLRAEGLAAGALQVFITTGRHGAGPHRHGALMAGFAHPTASTFEVVGLARRLLTACHRPADAAGRAYRYMKAGVVLTELGPRTACQADLFEARVAEHPALFEAVDRITARFGRHAVAVAAQGRPADLARVHAARDGAPAWAMSRSRMSPRYTTDWAGLPTVG